MSTNAPHVLPVSSVSSVPSVPSDSSDSSDSAVEMCMVTDENVRSCLADFGNRLDAAEAAFDSLRSAQTALSQVVIQVPNDIIEAQALPVLQLSSEIQDDNANVQAQVQGLSTDVTENKDSLSQLSGTVSALSEDVKTLSSEHKVLSEKVDKITQKLEVHDQKFAQVLLTRLESKLSGSAV